MEEDLTHAFITLMAIYFYCSTFTKQFQPYMLLHASRHIYSTYMPFSHLVMMCIACQNYQPIHDFPWKWTTRMRLITSVMSMIWMKLNNKDELINTTNVNDLEKNHNLWMPLKKHVMCMILTTYTQVTIWKTLWWHQ